MIFQFGDCVVVHPHDRLYGEYFHASSHPEPTECLTFDFAFHWTVQVAKGEVHFHRSVQLSHFSWIFVGPHLNLVDDVAADTADDFSWAVLEAIQ